MNDQLNHMTSQVAKGLMTRREFVGRAAALGVTAAVANTMLADSAAADAHATPKRGGMIKIGSSGGESTNTQDPALTASEVPLNNLYAWGETLTDLDLEGVNRASCPSSIRTGRKKSSKNWRGSGSLSANLQIARQSLSFISRQVFRNVLSAAAWSSLAHPSSWSNSMTV